MIRGLKNRRFSVPCYTYFFIFISASNMILYISHSKRTINLKVFYEFGHLFVHFCFWFQPNWHFQSVTTSDSLMNWRNAPKTYFIWFRLIVLDNFACRSLNAKLFFTAFFCQKSKKKKKKKGKRKKKQ